SSTSPSGEVAGRRPAGGAAPPRFGPLADPPCGEGQACMPPGSRLELPSRTDGIVTMSGVLAGRRIVVPETRELDVLVQMLERQGATAIRCPLVSIHDTPDQAPVVAWLRRFTEHPPDDLILMTGEGLQ